MTGSSSQPPSGLVGLCVLLGLIGLVFAGLGLWLVLRSHLLFGSLALVISSLTWASAWGLYERRKWGVILFGLLGMIGSINHLANTLSRNADLSRAGIAQVLVALFSIILAMIIPIGLIYIILLLWRRL